MKAWLGALLPKARGGARTLAPHLPAALVVAAFAISRLLYRTELGLAFDTSPFSHFLQYAPRWCLEQDFWSTILHLYHQAPLQNVLVGGAYVLLPEHAAGRVLEAIYVALGLTFALTLLATLRRVGVRAALAAPLVCAFVASPVVVGYEMWLFYHTPVITFLALGVWGTLRFYERRTFRAALFAFGMFTVVALFRNLYGVAWLAGVSLVVLARPPAIGDPRLMRRRALVAALLCIGLVGGWNLKTHLLVGSGGGGALATMNLAERIWRRLPGPERERLLAEGKVSAAVTREPFTPIERHGELRVPHAPTGVSLLDMTVTPTGQRNHHALEILLLAQRHTRNDARYLLRHYPEVYLADVRGALRDWYISTPSRDMVYGRSANKRLADRVEQPILRALGADQHGRVPLLGWLLPLLVLFGVDRALLRAPVASERAQRVALQIGLLTIVYATLATTLVSFGDYSRYRFDLDPLYLVLFALLVEQSLRLAAHAWRRARAMLGRPRDGAGHGPTPAPA